MEKRLVILMIAATMLYTWCCSADPEYQLVPSPKEEQTLVHPDRPSTALMYGAYDVDLEGTKLTQRRNGT